MHDPGSLEDHEVTLLHGMRCAVGPHESVQASIQIADGRVRCLKKGRVPSLAPGIRGIEVDLSTFLIMPGLINAHDHLQFALYPKLGNPPYRNYIEWGEDIHSTCSDLIAKHKSIEKNTRLWWGGIRNLLCGTTTVCHHDPLWPELQKKEFPVRVVQRYGWAHSSALGGDLCKVRSVTPDGSAFIVHACEGIDDLAREEIFALERLGVLDADTVLVHGLGLDKAGVALMQERQASLILCPSSNQFLFGRLPDTKSLGVMKNIGLGSDSPLTAAGDLLDEIRFAIESCGITPDQAYRMVTETAATILRLDDQDSFDLSGVADLIAVKDTGDNAADRLRTLSAADVELVVIEGKVQLASEAIWKLLPPKAKQGLEPLWIDESVRWLRAPVMKLVREAESVLGSGEIRLGDHKVRGPRSATAISTTEWDATPVRVGGRT